MSNGLIIFRGGGLDTLGRWWASGVVAERLGQSSPWGTLLVNVSGSFIF
jgi:CrcB protein